MNRRDFLVTTSAAALGAGTMGWGQAQAITRPNIIFFLVDDLGWGDFGCYGDTFHETPNIDQLARGGLKFTNAYAAAPVCSPSRAGLLTGQAPARLHLTQWIPGSHYPNKRLLEPPTPLHLDLNVPTLAEQLKGIGYETGAIGKWHLGGDGYLPENFGFDVNIAGDNHGHSLRLVLLWFGSFKNGEDHYVPEWIKTNPDHYPRIIDERGQQIQVLSPNSQANLDADKHAFVALTSHLAKIDGQQHTVIMIQVENESGSIGAVRDNSPMAQKEFEGQVPEVVLKSMHKPSGTWRQVFGFEADQYFEAYSVARYINTIAAAGKAELNIPMYCNVWVQYPRGYQIRGHVLPGFDYPSGGPAQPNIDLWKAVATSLDILGPDIYSADRGFERELMDARSIRLEGGTRRI